MFTHPELRNRLFEVGIDRDLRILTDWRQKGLLPPLQRTGAGRGRGVKWFWDEDPLDQAIAVDHLLKKSGLVDETVLGLWLAGFPVDTAAARRAWIQHLKDIKHRRWKAASGYSGGLHGVGKRFWKLLKSSELFRMPWWREPLNNDPKLLSNFLGDSVEWSFDEERDDEAYRNNIEELVISLTKANGTEVRKTIDAMWAKFDPASIFAFAPSLGFIRSVSVRELNTAHQSLRYLAQTLQQAQEPGGPNDRVRRVIVRLVVMRDLLGMLFVRFLVQANRKAQPLGPIILSVCDLLKSVQYTDITGKNDDALVILSRVIIGWEAAKKRLLAGSVNQPATMNGSPGPASG